MGRFTRSLMSHPLTPLSAREQPGSWTAEIHANSFSFVRPLSRLLLAGLLASPAFASDTHTDAAPTSSQQSAEIAPVSWVQVENTVGHLAFVQTLTAYALTAPIEEFPSALAAVERWPQLDSTGSPFEENFPLQPGARITRARRALAYSFITRAPEEAIAYHAHAPPEVLTHFRPVLFAELTRLELARARAELLKIPQGNEHQAAAAAIIVALSKTDPFAALALRHELNVNEPSAIAAAFETTARIDPHRALAALSTLPDTHLRTDARQRVLTEWILKSSDEALGWISNNVPKANRPAFLDVVLDRTGARNFALLASLEEQTRDPLIQAAATRAISSRLIYQPIQYAWDRVLNRGWEGIDHEPTSADRAPVLRTLDDLVLHASTQPPDQVRKFFRSLPAGYGKDADQVGAIMKAWTLADPDGALAWADKLPEGETRDLAFIHAQAMLVELDPQLAFARLRTLPPGEIHTRVSQMTFLELAKRDLKSAITQPSLVGSMLSELYGVGAVVRVASTYAPETMIELIRETSPPNFVTTAFAAEWLFNEPEDALAWYFDQPAGPFKTELQDPAARALARSDPARAIEFALSTPDRSERVTLIEALIDHHTTAEPASVLAVIETLPVGAERLQLYTNAISELAEADPVRAAAQLDSGALGPITSHAINAVAVKWSKESAAECARWLQSHLHPSQNSPELINTAVDHVAHNYAQQDPAAAVAWARSLADPAAAQQATAAAIESIGKSSRPLALRLLAESALPDKQKAELEATIRQ